MDPDTIMAEVMEPVPESAGVMAQPTALVMALVGDTEPDPATDTETEPVSVSMPKIRKSDRLILWPGGGNPTRS